MENMQNYASDNNSESNGFSKLCLNVFLIFVRIFIMGAVVIIIISAGIQIIDHIPRHIASEENDKYTVELLATSSPVFPFGSQDGRIILKEDSKKICKINFELDNDGKYMDESNWDVEWKSDKAVVTIIGEEQNDHKYILYYNGEIESVNSD